MMFQDSFFSLCEKYAAERENCGTERGCTRKIVSFSIEYRALRLEFLFRRSCLEKINNILYCRVYPDKSESVYYLLSEVFVLLGTEDYRAFLFSEIESEERLESCFCQLSAMIDDHFDEIERAAESGKLPLKSDETTEGIPDLKFVYHENAYIRDTFVIDTYTAEKSYNALLLGDLPKAIRCYEKLTEKNKATEYQKRLCGYLRAHPDFSPMPEECNAIKNGSVGGTFFIYAACFFAIYASFFALFILVWAVFTSVTSAGTVAYFGAPWFACFIFSALPAMAGLIAFRRPVVSILFRKRAAAINARDRLKNGRGTEILGRLIFVVAFGVMAAVFINALGISVRLYDDRMIIPSANESPYSYKEYEYERVEKVYHISARYNKYGEQVERSSYVLKMEDGRVFDLDGFTSEKETEAILFPLLRDYDIEFSDVDSDRDVK